MLSAAALRRVRSIVTHDSCADGLASAVLLHDALPDAEIQFVQYGTDAHRALTPREGLLFCDFSPPPEAAAEFARAGTIVLDHHRTAKDIVLAMGDNGVYADEKAEPGVAGALLAYRHVWLPLRGESSSRPFAEHFATVAGVRDTWQTKSPLWREAQVQTELLMTLPRAWWLGQSMAQLESTWSGALVQLGDALLAKREDRVRRAIARGHRFIGKDGVRILALAGTGQTSDAAEVLGTEVDVVLGFDYGEESGVQRMRFSIRSHTTFDCAAFSANHGGGGHTRAAGFGIALGPGDSQPYTMVERLFGVTNG
jgi:hypothetical protein